MLPQQAKLSKHRPQQRTKCPINICVYMHLRKHTFTRKLQMGNEEKYKDPIFNENQVPSLEIEDLKIISAVGRGAKGVVFLVENDSDSGPHHLALKLILRSSIEKKKKKNGDDDKNIVNDEYRRVCFEQRVLNGFKHPLLPKLRGVLSTDKVVGFAIDYCPGGNLNSLRNNQIEKMFSDDVIRFYAAELVLALEHLHNLGIVYRDLKPENVMIQENGHIMLVDFDLSTNLSPRPTTPQCSPTLTFITKTENPKKTRRRFISLRCCYTGISPCDSDNSVNPAAGKSETTDKSNSFVGTEDYVAPEIIKGEGHDFAVDWWSLGVVLYEMLYGKTPFRGADRKETFYRILCKEVELIGQATPLRDLIRKLLEKDCMRRITVEDIKGHEFFRGVDWDCVVGISRPPYIPTDTENQGEGGGGIEDVECFVEGIFLQGSGNDNRRENHYDKKDDGNVNKGGVCVGEFILPEKQEFCVF